MKRDRYVSNTLFVYLLIIYIIVLSIISAIACYFAFQQKRDEIFSQININMAVLDREQRDIFSNFWQIYMPLFESRNSVSDILTIFFIHEGEQDRDLLPLERIDLTDALVQMMFRDDRIDWIAVYSEHRSTNYVVFRNQRLLVSCHYLYSG